MAEMYRKQVWNVASTVKTFSDDEKLDTEKDTYPLLEDALLEFIKEERQNGRYE